MPESDLITDGQIGTRKKWVQLLSAHSGEFTETSAETLRVLDTELAEEDGLDTLLGHLRFCGTIPEEYRHDSTEEKAYSKYTDAVVAEALRYSGLTAVVLDGRADMADVEAVGGDFDLVADAKAFRLTRTAKNQKDFKVAAMDRWRYGKQFAVVVCPVYHLPSSTSQIYLDASSRNVCLLTFSHLAALVKYNFDNPGSSMDILHQILDVPATLNPSKSAGPYWQAINGTMLAAPSMTNVWRQEKRANTESLRLLKDEALSFLSRERTRIMRMSHQEALQSLIAATRIDAREAAVRGFRGNTLLDV